MEGSRAPLEECEKTPALEGSRAPLEEYEETPALEGSRAPLKEYEETLHWKEVGTRNKNANCNMIVVLYLRYIKKNCQILVPQFVPLMLDRFL